jgi:hypothetical protein
MVWVVHWPVGLAVIPARWTRLVACSMTNSTWNRLSNAVSTQAKSVAMIACDWDRMNWDQVGPVRSRVGLIPAARRIFQTVEAAMVCPSRRSSPWMRRYPQFGFSLARRLVSRRRCGSMGGRPRGLFGGWVQWRAICCLCQRRTVSGLTIRNALRRRARLIADPRRPRMVRSVSVKCGQLIWRCRTRIWWRRARISASRATPVANIHLSLLKTSRTRAGNRVTSAEGYRRARWPKPAGLQYG